MATEQILPRSPRPATLTLLLMGSMLGPMAGATIMPVLEVMRADLGVSGAAAGLILTTHGLAIAVFSPLAGWMIDRWGIRRPLAGGLVLYGLAGGAGIFTTSYPGLIASRAVFGIGGALVLTGTTVAMLALWQGTVRNRVMGWRTTATSLSGVAFPLLGGGLATVLSWHAAFGVYLVGIPIGLAVLAVVPPTCAAPVGQSTEDKHLFRLVPARRRLLGLYGMLFARGVMMYSMVVFLPQRLSHLGVTAPALVSAYIVSMAGTASLVGLVYGRLRSRISPLALLSSAALMWTAAFVILGIVVEPSAVLIAPVLLGLGSGLMSPTLSILIAELVPQNLLGRATAVSSMAVALGQFSSPLLLGPVIAATSIATGYLAVAGAAALILSVLTLIRLPTRGSFRVRSVGRADHRR